MTCSRQLIELDHARLGDATLGNVDCDDATRPRLGDELRIGQAMPCRRDVERVHPPSAEHAARRAADRRVETAVEASIGPVAVDAAGLEQGAPDAAFGVDGETVRMPGG